MLGPPYYAHYEPKANFLDHTTPPLLYPLPPPSPTIPPGKVGVAPAVTRAGLSPLCSSFKSHHSSSNTGRTLLRLSKLRCEFNNAVVTHTPLASCCRSFLQSQTRYDCSQLHRNQHQPSSSSELSKIDSASPAGLE